MATSKLNFTSPVMEFEVNGKTYSFEYGNEDAAAAIARIGSTEGREEADELVDAIFGAGSAAEIFAEYPRNTFVRSSFLATFIEAVEASPQVKANERIRARYAPETIDDGDGEA